MRADHATPPLPKDPGALRALLLATLEACQTLTTERDEMAAQRDALEPFHAGCPYPQWRM